MKIIQLRDRPADWDKRIQGFSQKTLFHESAWLDFIKTAQPHSRIGYYEIRRGPDCVGYFCAIIIKKLIFSFCGSPLPGMGMYMGPLIDSNSNQSELLQVLINYCRAQYIAHFDLVNDWLDPDIMKSAGFRMEASVTHVCPLSGDEQEVWAAMKSACRNRIRKAEGEGLAAEIATGPEVVDQFYSQFSRCLALKGLKPPYDIEHARTLFHHLAAADRLFALRIKLGGRVLATGLYLHDDRTIYYFDSGYEPECLQFYPNELLHWSAMKLAMQRGIREFNIGGGPKPSRFTEKFGGSDRPYRIYHKSLVPLLDEARNFYHFLRQIRNK